MGIADIDYHAFLKNRIEEAVSDLDSAYVNELIAIVVGGQVDGIFFISLYNNKGTDERKFVFELARISINSVRAWNVFEYYALKIEFIYSLK